MKIIIITILIIAIIYMFIGMLIGVYHYRKTGKRTSRRDLIKFALKWPMFLIQQAKK